MRPRTCPDCTKALGPRGLWLHAPSCPIWMGVNRAAADDRQWFAKRRALGITERERPAVPAELRECELAHPGEHYIDGRVTVTEVRPGVLVRQLFVTDRP